MYVFVCIVNEVSIRLLHSLPSTHNLCHYILVILVWKMFQYWGVCILLTLHQYWQKIFFHFIAVISIIYAFISLEIVPTYNQFGSVAFHRKYFLLNAIFNQYGYLMGSFSDESNIGPPCNQNNQYWTTTKRSMNFCQISYVNRFVAQWSGSWLNF